MAEKETSSQVSSAAARLTDTQPEYIVAMTQRALESGDDGELAEFCRDVRSVAASALSQDETRGQE